MNDIFISYSQDNKYWVSTLAEALTIEGFSVYWNREALEKKENDQQLKRAIENSQCVITIWSESSVHSHTIKEESLKALKMGKLISVLYEPVIPPASFRTLTSEGLQGWVGNRQDLRYLQLLQQVLKHGTATYQRSPEDRNSIPTMIENYIDHMDGTITDLTTHLMWKKFSEGQQDQDCDPSMVKTYSWDYAVGNFQDVSFAGYHNWRLPTIKELSTLIHCSNKLPQHLSRLEGCDAQWKIQGKSTKPTLNHRVFPNAPAQRYWSSSPFYDNKDYAKAVCFYSGHVEELYKHHNLSVRLVRNTTSQENYLR